MERGEAEQNVSIRRKAAMGGFQNLDGPRDLARRVQPDGEDERVARLHRAQPGRRLELDQRLILTFLTDQEEAEGMMQVAVVGSSSSARRSRFSPSVSRPDCR